MQQQISANARRAVEHSVFLLERELELPFTSQEKESKTKTPKGG